MAIAKRIVDGWSVAMDGDEPTILDEQLGARLGFARPRDVRKLIERLLADEILNESDVRAIVARRLHGIAWKATTSYHLTETAALLVIARSNTKIAHAITRQVVQVFIAVRRGQLAVPQQVPVLSTSPNVGDGHLRTELAARCRMAARCLGVGTQRVHGFIRRQFRVPGVYLLPVVLYPMARDLLEALALGRLLLPGASARRLPAAAESAQGMLPFPAASDR